MFFSSGTFIIQQNLSSAVLIFCYIWCIINEDVFLSYLVGQLVIDLYSNIEVQLNDVSPFTLAPPLWESLSPFSSPNAPMGPQDSDTYLLDIINTMFSFNPQQAMLNGELSFALSQQENDASSATDQPADGIDGGQDRVARQQSMTGSRKGRSGGAQLEKQGSIMSNYFSPVPDRSVRIGG